MQQQQRAPSPQPQLLLLLLLVLLVVTAVHPAAANPPPLSALGSGVIQVRSCRPSATAPCGDAAATNSSAHCMDLGCCWLGGSLGCVQPVDQATPPDPAVQRYASNQAIASLSGLPGQLQASRSGDPLGVSCLTFPPFAQTCDSGLDFAGNSTLQGVNLAVGCQNLSYQWFAHELHRFCTLPPATTNESGPIAVHTITRIDQALPRIYLTVTANASASTTLSLATTLQAYIGDFADKVWGWTVPRPSSSNSFTGQATHLNNVTLAVTRDSSTSAASVATAVPLSADAQVSLVLDADGSTFRLNVNGPSPLTFGLVLHVGTENSISAMQAQVAGLATSSAFTAAFSTAAVERDNFWIGSFAPNTSFPGAFPVLTTDDGAFATTYYMGLLSFWITGQRNNLTNNRVLFGTGGPVSAVSALYIWDSTLNSNLWILLDPDTYLQVYTWWLQMDVHQHYAIDYVSRQPVGPWYAFNDYQMFRGLYAAAQFLGPVEMLRQWQALGKTGFVWLRHFALAWMSLSTNSQAPAPHPPSRTPNHQPSTLVSTRGAYCSHLNGTMLGYWDQTHRLSPGYIFIRGDHLGNVVVYQTKGAGWVSGNGTITPDNAVLSLYDDLGTLHATLSGKADANCTTVAWSNNSTWCFNGTSALCTAPAPDPLTDYGTPANLLECVPTYQHKVPSLNAANAYMMAEIASMELADLFPNSEEGQVLNYFLDTIIDSLMARSYVNGSDGGFWKCIQPNGSGTVVRHVIDFVTILLTIGRRIDTSVHKEMVDFVGRELLTPHWMRALSLHDAAAPKSDRKDHGPWGSYDGWLGETVGALSALCEFDQALELIHRMSTVYANGPGGQSHQIFGTSNATITLLPQKAHADQQFFATSGGVTANNIISWFFGLQPSVLDNSPTPDQGDWIYFPNTPRGVNAVLSGVLVRGRAYNLTSGPQGIRMIPAA